jgi:DNA invertase Pin-like site-specific DNA recombinase
MKRKRKGIRTEMEQRRSPLKGCVVTPRIGGEAAMRKCGLFVRVSKDEQARYKEISITNQLEKLRALLGQKNRIASEPWVEAERYELKGVSGKDALKSKEFAKLFEDIRAGRINTVVCTELNRICRSEKDFLTFGDFLTDHNVEFVCTDSDYDTTSPEWKLIMAIKLALVVFETERTNERVRAARLAITRELS